jgi:uncharacterized membrane protein YfcA
MSNTIVVCLAALLAGFIDASIGGGGLIQTPVIFMTFPNLPVANLLGTTKIPSFSGTTVSFYQYAKHVSIEWKLIIWVALAAFCSSMLGSRLVNLVSNQTFKPIILIALIFVAVYMYAKKNFGQQKALTLSLKQSLTRGILLGLIIGFYDGFIGPGTGSFLVLIFIGLLGQDFIHASAHAKIVNLATNVASIIYFTINGNILFELAIPMAACNMLGGFIGSKFALLKGNKFIRMFFLCVVCATIVRFGYDVFLKQ